MRKFGFVLPEVLDSEDLEVAGEGLFHLFLEDPVRNPVRLSALDRLTFLTGPNMAGKTTYLKTLAVAVYLAHLGMGVPARAFRFTPLGALFTSLSPEESIREGLSYFMAEVRRVKSVASGVARAPSALVVFDEVFRGTNVRDALDASLLVIRGFARNVRCLSLFSSHLVELADRLASEPGVRFQRFEGGVEDGRAVYGFRLEEGVSSQRFGLRLLEQEGLPGLLGMAGE
jgi:DNA mismatch repair ATPase MutS